MGLMKKLTSAIVASSLVLSLVGTAFAAYTPAAGETAGNRMQTLGMIQGKPGLGLDLNGEITRAELVTVIVRAFGQEENAKLLVGAAAYPDTSSHWASGNIAMAKALIEKQGESMGMPDGTFAPDAKLTPAQAVAFLMKFLGVKADAAKVWPANFLDAAVAANIITAEDNALIAPMLNSNATRGLVFYLFDNAFYSYDLGAGKTFYTKYVDMTAPVITLTAVEPTTLDSKVTISGKADGATEVYVGTEKVTLDAAGNFSADYNLPEMKEYTITVTARDLAGNVKEAPVTVTRTVGNVATIEAAAITVAAGATVDVAAVAKDVKGNVVQTAVTGESNIGTYADGKFTAGKVAGTGTLTLKSGDIASNVNVTVTAGPLAKVEADKTSVAPGGIVTLTAKDEHGNILTGVTYSQTSANAMLDAVNGKFMASAAGNYTVTATAGGVSKDITIGVYSGTVAKYGVTLSTPTVVANNATTITATISALDANGNLVANDASAGITISAPEFEQKDGTAVPATVTLKNGVKTLTLRTKSTTVGGQIATVKANATLATEGKAQIELLEQVATSIAVEAVDKYVATNAGTETAEFTVNVLDQNGKAMLTTGGTRSISLTLTGPAKITDINGVAVTAGTSKTMIFSGVEQTVVITSVQNGSGPVALTAESTGLTTGTASLTAQTAGVAAKIQLTNLDTDGKAIANETARTTDEVIKFRAVVTDANGVPIKTATPTTVKAVFDLANTKRGEVLVSAATTEAGLTVFRDLNTDAVAGHVAEELVLTFANGVAYFGVKADNFTGDLSVTVKDTAASPLTSANGTMTFVADTFTKVGLDRGTVYVTAASPEATVTAQLYDAAGNKVAKEGVELKLAGANDDVTVNGKTKEAKATTDASGVATFTVKVLGYVNSTYTLTVSGTDESGAALTVAPSSTLTTAVKVQNTVVASVTVDIIADGGSLYRGLALTAGNSVGAVDSGSTVTVKATLKDAYGKAVIIPVAYQDLSLTVVEGKIVETAPVALTDLDLDGTYEAVITAKAAGRLVVKVEDATSSATVAANDAISVVAGSPAKIRVSRVNDTDALSVASAKVTGPFMVQVVDANNNVVVAPAEYTVNLSGTGLQFRETETGANVTSVKIAAGTTSATFYVVTAATAGTSVTLTVDGPLTDDSVTVNVTN